MIGTTCGVVSHSGTSLATWDCFITQSSSSLLLPHRRMYKPAMTRIDPRTLSITNVEDIRNLERCNYVVNETGFFENGEGKKKPSKVDLFMQDREIKDGYKYLYERGECCSEDRAFFIYTP